MTEPRLGYVNVTVSDFDRAVAFFRDTIGLPFNFADAEFGYASFATRGAAFAVVQAPEGEEVGRHTGVGFVVEDLDAAHAALAEKGRGVSTPADAGAVGRLHGDLCRPGRQYLLFGRSVRGPRLTARHGQPARNRVPMSTNEWQPTACNLCYANCGILARVDDATGRQIEKIKGDRAHPASKGYLCNKASRINYYQNHRDRLDSPLRKRPDGTFEPVSWDVAIREVAARFAEVRDTHGGDKILYYGGGGQGNHLGGAHAGPLLRALGVRYRSNAPRAGKDRPRLDEQPHARGRVARGLSRLRRRDHHGQEPVAIQRLAARPRLGA